MAFDGITVANLTKDFSDQLTGGRIYKIAQTESDELSITVKLSYEAAEKFGLKQQKLLLSSDASLPLAYFTEDSKPSPMTAPNFCMLLRKHIQNGRISISLFSDSEKELLLTIPYEEGWKATNNGEDTRIDKAFNCFMTIKLKPGTNNIEITYTVRGLYLGIVISIISVILCAVIGIIDSRRRQKKGAI